MKKTWRILGFLALWMLSSCGPSIASVPPSQNLVLITPNPNASVTPTPFQPLPASSTPLATATSIPADTSVPTDTPTLPPTPTDTSLPAPAPPTATPVPQDMRTLYTLYVTMDYAGRAVAVNETIQYFNATGESLSSLVLAAEPNYWPNCFTLNSLTLNGAPDVSYQLDGHKLTIPLPKVLAPSAAATLQIQYALNLPQLEPASPNLLRPRIFGYTANQMNLSDWYPFVVPFIDGGWVLHDHWYFGDHLVYDSVDFDVYVKVNDSRVSIAASAPSEPAGDWTRYQLTASRTFVMSASDRFKVDDSAVGTVKILSYYFAGHENAGGAVLWMATQSLGLYDVKFAPFPYRSLSVVETDVPDGQEYDGLVFLSSQFYTNYNGTAKSDLIMIGTHEIAHQWWFGLLSGDRAEEPWLNEAMAVYGERLFYQYNYPNYGNWWWDYRVNYFGPTGYVDGNIYSYSSFRQFVNAVYLNGANFMEELRGRMGDESFFAFLKDYASRYAHQHVTADDFFATVRLHTDADLSDLVQKYFQTSH